MDIEVEIRTSDADAVLRAVTGADEPARGHEVEIADGALLRLVGVERARAGGAAELIMFALSIPAGVATSVIADAINRHLRRTSRDKPIESVRLKVQEQVDTVDAHGNHTTRTTIRYEEIPLPAKAS
jgi:hypothetical protein